MPYLLGLLALGAAIALEFFTDRYKRKALARRAHRRVLEWESGDFWPGNAPKGR